MDTIKDLENKGVKDTQVLDEAPSGEASNTQELKYLKVLSPTDKEKETVVDLSSGLEIDTYAIAKGHSPQISISFNKPYLKMSLAEKILAVVALQA